MNKQYTVPGTETPYERVEARDPADEHCTWEHPSGRYRIVWEGNNSFRTEAVVPIARTGTMHEAHEIISGALALEAEAWDKLLDLASS